MNIQDIILLVILAACIFAAILAISKNKKGCCGGNCNACHYCLNCRSCHDASKKTK